LKKDDRPFHAVVWDLGGVIVRTLDWGGRSRWEKRAGLSPHELEQIVFRGEMGVRAALGQANSDDVWTWVLQRLGFPKSERTAIERDFFSGDQVDNDLISFIRSLRPEYKTGIISNAWPELRHWLEVDWRIADAFDHIVISAEVGVLKPDPLIYHLALNGLGVAPNETIFIDDLIENVVGALDIGMQAIHFRTTEQVTSELQALLDLPL
jgi:epoxide hydrolase-like predicted phosphatase